MQKANDTVLRTIEGGDEDALEAYLIRIPEDHHVYTPNSTRTVTSHDKEHPVVNPICW
jgi:hypothetical protein